MIWSGRCRRPPLSTSALVHMTLSYAQQHAGTHTAPDPRGGRGVHVRARDAREWCVRVARAGVGRGACAGAGVGVGVGMGVGMGGFSIREGLGGVRVRLVASAHARESVARDGRRLLKSGSLTVSAG